MSKPAKKKPQSKPPAKPPYLRLRKAAKKTRKLAKKKK
jgi:hypothetical protein